MAHTINKESSMIWQRHFGVYGIYYKNDHLLVVDKKRGPYINRYDLPGGSLGANESLLDGLKRELYEEIGYGFNVKNQLGLFEYLIPYDNKSFTHLHHLAMYWMIDTDEQLGKQKCGDDTRGYELLKLDRLNDHNASPLVMEALNIINGSINPSMKIYREWVINSER